MDRSRPSGSALRRPPAPGNPWLLLLGFAAAATVAAEVPTWDAQPLFNQPEVGVPSEYDNPCPFGARHMTDKGSEDEFCHCDFGFHGHLLWDSARQEYQGECTRTPCPDNAVPDVQAGDCDCVQPYVGVLEWHEPHGDLHTIAYFSGVCVEQMCPQGTILHLMGADKATTSADLVGLKPKCACHGRYVGGYHWSIHEHAFLGECVLKDLCPPGFAGAHVVDTGDEEVAIVGECERVPCPSFARVNETSGFCDCEVSEGYVGNLSWNQEYKAYNGRCQSAFVCPPNTEHQFIRISTARESMGCACANGFTGGVMEPPCVM